MLSVYTAITFPARRLILITNVAIVRNGSWAPSETTGAFVRVSARTSVDCMFCQYRGALWACTLATTNARTFS
jgi:hypothetical protein